MRLYSGRLLFDYAVLVVLVILGSAAGYLGIPIGLEALSLRAARHPVQPPPAEACRPSSVKLLFTSDAHVTHVEFVATLLNPAGGAIMEQRGPDRVTGCGFRRPRVDWDVDRRDVMLLQDPYVTNFAEFYPLPGDYLVTATFTLEDGVQFAGRIGLHVPTRRERERGTLEGIP